MKGVQKEARKCAVIPGGIEVGGDHRNMIGTGSGHLRVIKGLVAVAED